MTALKQGLMIQDSDSKTTLEAKVRAAAMAYRRKFDTAPNCCHAHKSLVSEPFEIDGIMVLPLGKPQHHILIGVV